MQRFPTKPIHERNMRLAIDRQYVDPDLVTYNPGMGFGRFDSDTIEVHSYELFIDRADLVEEFSAVYRAVCGEIRGDDEKFGEESDFKASGYTELDEAFSEYACLSNKLKRVLLESSARWHLPSSGGPVPLKHHL